MKASLVLLLVLAVVGINADHVHLAGEQKEKANKYITECVKETGVSTDALDEAKKGNYIDDEGLKKFVFCFFKKAGIVSTDGKLNVDVALAKLPPGVDKNDAAKVLEECKSKTDKDVNETVFAIFKCYYQGIKTHILFD